MNAQSSSSTTSNPAVPPQPPTVAVAAAATHAPQDVGGDGDTITTTRRTTTMNVPPEAQGPAPPQELPQQQQDQPQPQEDVNVKRKSLDSSRPSTLTDDVMEEDEEEDPSSLSSPQRPLKRSRRDPDPRFARATTRSSSQKQQQQQAAAPPPPQQQEEPAAATLDPTLTMHPSTTTTTTTTTTLTDPTAASSTIVSYVLEEGATDAHGHRLPTQLRMTTHVVPAITNTQDAAQPAPTTTIQDDDKDDQHTTTIRLQPGDDVLLFQANEEEEEDEDDENTAKETHGTTLKTLPPARIQSFYARDGAVYFNAQWFLSKQDISQLPQSVPWSGPLTREELLDSMKNDDRDLVLSNQMDENEIGAILGLAQVDFNSSNDDNDDNDEAPPSSDSTTSYRCRYQLQVTPTEMRLLPYTDQAADPTGTTTSTTNNEEDDHPPVPSQTTTAPSTEESASDPDEGRRAPHENASTRTKNRNPHPDDGDDDDDETSSSSESDNARMVVAEGEGSVLRESIEVGPEHQAVVPPFDPASRMPRSRNPTLVWKKGLLTNDQIAEFMDRVAEKHNRYLDQQRLSAATNATYTPILDVAPLDRVLQQHTTERLTGSSLSTASMLAGADRRGTLRKECDADALLAILTDCQGNVAQAVERATAQLDHITRGAWTMTERAQYNKGFRQYQAALWKIAKYLAPAKSMQEVVDYHFRCKIPDQFRQYQDKKREIAVRIVECMEEKRSHQTNGGGSSSTSATNHAAATTKTTATEGDESHPPPPPLVPPPPQPHWSELSVQDVATYTETRRRKARDLMLDIQEELGDETLAKVATWIRQLNHHHTNHNTTTAAADTKVRHSLLTTLQGHASLHERMMEFLPPS